MARSCYTVKRIKNKRKAHEMLMITLESKDLDSRECDPRKKVEAIEKVEEVYINVRGGSVELTINVGT